MAYPFQLVQLLQVQVHRRSFEHHICFNDNDHHRSKLPVFMLYKTH